MEFLLIAHDGKDEEALNRRLAVREQHLALFDRFYELGVFKYGCAILDDDQRMVGSVVACEFSSREELQKAWLAHEPYVLGDVWRQIEIIPIRTRIAQGLFK
jgi:uncharacterized protein